MTTLNAYTTTNTETVTGPGWERITPARGKRTYRDDDGVTYQAISGLPPSSDWGPIERARTARWAAEHASTVSMIEATEGADAAARTIRHSSTEGLSATAARGTEIHAWLEDVLGNESPRTLSPAAIPWLEAATNYARSVIDDDHTTRWAEVVCACNRGTPIAGTIDRLDIDSEGHAVIIDYKTRSSTGSHRPYDSEIRQLGAYAYAVRHGWWWAPDGQQVRRTLPVRVELVTLDPEGGAVVHRVAASDAMTAHEARVPLIQWDRPTIDSERL